MTDLVRVGVVSDTHGLFDPRLEELFAGVDLILHAGDVVRPSNLEDLRRIAPVHAVRGNNDVVPTLAALPEIAAVELGAVTAVVVHEIGARGRLAPAVRRAVARHRARIVVYGHSHRPHAGVEGDVLYVNPGSAGPRRFSLPRAAGILEVARRRAEVTLFDLASPRLRVLGAKVVAEL